MMTISGVKIKLAEVPKKRDSPGRLVFPLDKLPVLWPSYRCADLIDQLAGAEEVLLKRIKREKSLSSPPWLYGQAGFPVLGFWTMRLL
jgi:hypothetical protein